MTENVFEDQEQNVFYIFMSSLHVQVKQTIELDFTK